MRSVARCGPLCRFIVELAALALLASAAVAQTEKAIKLKGYIAAVRSDGFDVGGMSIDISEVTHYYSFFGSQKSERELRLAVGVDKPVMVEGIAQQNLRESASGANRPEN
ncbi:MAG TPA: hypothetical protein VMT38_06060 [Terracidiphilus sp.]|nr:hypothetical protein [Terracidiphilus sp.]